MITVFNRRELMVTFKQEQLFRIQSALGSAGIPCAVRIPGGYAGQRLRSRTGTQEYVVYVHKEDYDRACAVRAAAMRSNG